MNRLDDELHMLLGRKEPPEGFAERVFARMEAVPSRLNVNPQRRRTVFQKSWVGWAAGIAACLILAISFVWYRRYQHQRANAALASQQATMALRIASSQLNRALQQAQEVTREALAVNSKKQMERL